MQSLQRMVLGAILWSTAGLAAPKSPNYHAASVPHLPTDMRVFDTLLPRATPPYGPGRTRMDNLHYGWAIYPTLNSDGLWTHRLARATGLTGQQASWLAEASWEFPHAAAIATGAKTTMMIQRLELSAVLRCEPSGARQASCIIDAVSVRAAGADAAASRAIPAFTASWVDALRGATLTVRQAPSGLVESVDITETGPAWLARPDTRPLSSPDGQTIQAFARKLLEPVSVDRPKSKSLRPMAWSGYFPVTVDTWFTSNATIMLHPAGARLGKVDDDIVLVASGEGYTHCGMIRDLCQVLDARLQNFDLSGQFREATRAGSVSWVVNPSSYDIIALQRSHVRRIDTSPPTLAASGLVTASGELVPK